MECRCEEKVQLRWADHRNEAKSNALRRVLRTGLLRLLGANRGCDEFSSDQEEIGQVGISADNHYNYGKEIETALLDAERKKAEALAEWQKHRFIC